MKYLISDLTIKREYVRTHDSGEDYQLQVDKCTIFASDFTEEDRALSLDDFSRKQGWME